MAFSTNESRRVVFNKHNAQKSHCIKITQPEEALGGVVDEIISTMTGESELQD